MFSRMFHRLRVTPPPVLDRVTYVPADDMETSRARRRDESSSWACEIVYVDDKEQRSERQITCRSLNGYGGITHIEAFCHSRERPRSFRIDRIVELVDLSTGEVVDPVSHFEMLGTVGVLPYEDKGFTAFVQIATFMAKCDGEYHPLEVDALEAAITAYAIRFNGTDEMIEGAMARLPAIAPDGGDVAKAVKRLRGSPIGSRASRLILDHCSQIMNADGRHHAQEVAWAVELGAALKQAAA